MAKIKTLKELDTFIYPRTLASAVKFSDGTSLEAKNVASKDDLPTKVSQLENDSGFITSASLNTKQDTLVSGQNIKTVNGQSILGSGDIDGGKVDDVKLDNESIVTNKIANLDSNTIVEVSDAPTKGKVWFNSAPSSSETIKVYTAEELDELLQGNADAHNNFLIEKDITSYVNDGSLWNRIAGTGGYKPMEGIYPGCYIKMSRPISAYEQTGQYQLTGSQYVTVAGINVYKGDGNSPSLTKNHIVMVPGQGVGGTQHFGRSRMNPTNDTTGAYQGSEMFTTTIGPVATEGSIEPTATINEQLYAEFGSHLQSYNEILSNSLNKTGYNRFGTASGCSNGWSWVTTQARLMSEIEVYGSTVWSSSGYDTGNAKWQLPLFRLSKYALNNRNTYYWLKDVASASLFCFCSDRGYATYHYASTASDYVRPRFILA